MLQNIFKVISSKIGIIGTIIGIAIIAIPSYYFFESELVIGNFGYSYYLLELTLTILISILFGFFIGSTLYKIKLFNTTKSGLGLFAGFLGILVSGCPACSITLVSYLGLSGIIAVFPFGGIELKVVSVLMLLYIVFVIIKNLEVCKIKKKLFKNPLR